MTAFLVFMLVGYMSVASIAIMLAYKGCVLSPAIIAILLTLCLGSTSYKNTGKERNEKGKDDE